jgi:hypothetical protein
MEYAHADPSFIWPYRMGTDRSQSQAFRISSTLLIRVQCLDFSAGRQQDTLVGLLAAT